MSDTKIYTSIEDINPENVPKTWTIEEVLRAKLTLQHFRKKWPAEFVSGDSEDWFNAGKERQLEHLAKLHEDPQWLEIAKRLGAKGEA